MSTKPKYVQLAEKYPNTIVLQLRGKFFNAFGDSARVLSSVLKYELRVTTTGTCKAGFPIEVSDKKFEEMEKFGVSFIAVCADQVVKKYDAGSANRFESIFETIKDKEPIPAKSDSGKKPEGEATEQKSSGYTLYNDILERVKKFCADKPGFSKDVCFNWILDEGLKKWGY